MEAIIREGSLRLQASEGTCDVILSCQGHRLMAHKIMLSIASPILRNLLEPENNVNEPQILIFPDTSSTTMSLILDFIYTGSVTVYSNIIDDFISTAKLLDIRINNEFLEQYDKKIKKEFKPESIENDQVFSRLKHQRKLPKLVPISNYTARKSKTIRKLSSCVIPSPWCPRVMPVLSDPRTNYDTQILHGEAKREDENDANNNLQRGPVTEIDLSSNFSRNEINLRDSTEKSDNNICKTGKEKPFKCEDCGKCFSQLRNYKYHRSVHEGTKEFSAKCSECGKIFNDKGYLSSHMKIHRDRKEYACPHCPKRFNQRVAYNMHLRIHTGVKPHECPTCGKSFSRKMLLKQHQRVHTGERPYSCPECGKTFADRSNMSLHARLHTGVKPYECSLCPKSFTKKHHLKTHMNFHTGLKPYKCQLCGVAFSQSSNMRTHYKKCLLKGANSAPRDENETTETT